MKKPTKQKPPSTQRSLDGWHAGALEVLDPLRWHLNELICSMEQLNRFERSLGRPTWDQRKIEAARAANERANQYFTPKPRSRYEQR